MDPAGGQSELGPVSTGERVVVLDVLRGVSVFGILLFNIGFFSFPGDYSGFYAERFPATADQAAIWFTRLFVEGKFYSLFSFLFGVGMAAQLSRARERGLPVGPLFRRRLLVLLAMGVLHDILLWPGAILIAYGLLGFVPLLFRDRQQRTLLIWALVLALIPALLVAGGLTVAASRAAAGQEAADAAASREEAQRQEFEEELELFQHGSYPEMVVFRLEALPATIVTLLALGPYVVAMFLLGMWTWRHGLLQDLPGSRSLLRHSLWTGLLLGSLGHALSAWIRVTSTPDLPVPMEGLAFLAQYLGTPPLAIAYGSAVLLMVGAARDLRPLAPVAAVGRTALSNYLLQNLVGTTVFYSYGFARFGTVGPAAGLALAIALFAGQLVLSRWWLKRYRFGPAECLWRSLTYGRWQRLSSRPCSSPPSTTPGGG